MPAKIQKVIDNDTQVKELGVEMKDASSVIFLGRHVGFPRRNGRRTQAQGNHLHPR